MKALRWFAIFLAGGHAAAQTDSIFESQANMYGEWGREQARTTTLNAAIKKSAGRAAGRSRRARNPSVFDSLDLSSAAGADLSALRFQPSPEISKEMKEEFVRAIQRNSRATDAEIATLRDRDILAAFARDVAPYGLRSDDVADAMTAFWVMMWTIANQQEIPAKDKVSGVQDQLRAALLQDPGITRASDKDRQKLTEGTIYETEIAITMRDNARKRGFLKARELADQAHKNMLRKHNLDLRSLQLTAAGFVPGMSH